MDMWHLIDYVPESLPIVFHTQRRTKPESANIVSDLIRDILMYPLQMFTLLSDLYYHNI